MQLELRYEINYQYRPAVPAGNTLVRLRPRIEAGQTVRNSTLSTRPGSIVVSYVDGWGTPADVVHFGTPHDTVRFELRATVETSGYPDRPPHPGDHFIFAGDSPRADRSEVTDLLQELPMSGATWPDIEALLQWIPANFAYRPGETHVHSSLRDLLTERVGVCQDFVHVSLAVLRAWGWPACYVSGYALSGDENDAAGFRSEAMHAWLEVLHPQRGWIGFDATNGAHPDERYVVVGRGRDYDDVPPVRGVLRGDTEQEHQSNLTIASIGGQ